MLIMAIDTSGSALGVAILDKGEILAETILDISTPHSVALMPLVEDLLGHCGLSADSPDAYACATGPGSFTGIRIGLSAVKAMAYAAGKPAIGVSSLKAMAWPYMSQPDRVVCPAIDARNGRIYAAAYQHGKQLVEARNWLASDYVETLVRTCSQQDTCLLVGFRSQAFYRSDGRTVLENTLNAPSTEGLRPSSVAELARVRLEAGEEGLPQTLEPQYLSLSQAERMKAKRG